MGANSKIEWTDHTFNPWRGCTKVAAGCANCYAARDAKRFPDRLGIWGDDGTRVVAAESTWKEPGKWNKQLHVECLDPTCRHRWAPKRNCLDEFCPACGFPEAKEVRPRVFCASLADIFEDWVGQVQHSAGVPMWLMNQDNGHTHRWGAGHVLDDPTTGRPLRLADVRRRLFALIDATPNLDWLLLTKRPENIARFWCEPTDGRDESPTPHSDGRANVWLGTSIATQEDADRNIPELLKCRDLAPVLFVSAEPLLGPVDLFRSMTGDCPSCGHDMDEHDAGSRIVGCSHGTGASDDPICGCRTIARDLIDWLICGGESGHGARPMHPDWARSLRDQCTAAGVPFFFKQWGEWGPIRFDGDQIDIDNHDPNKVIATGEGSTRRIMKKSGKANTGRELDGRTWDELPAGAEVQS